MKLYNTLTKKKEEFIPLEKNLIKMYVCGPTVYDFIHIGNARPIVIFDTVRRYFEYKGYTVNYVQNFTDVDDKIINKANAEGLTMNDISTRYINEAIEDFNGLNIKKATHNPKVTEEIEHIIQMIKQLIEKGHAYVKNDNVYFDTKSFKEYGKLSGKILDELEIGSRIKLDESKKSPNDFVLWKPKKEGEPYWDSPWGQGRPGWHIECSVMAKRYLGDQIDIHAGGEDLIFPHHENEIAQSEACNEKFFAKYWLHNGFINIDNEKMSKSKGNFFTIREISEKVPYDVIRFFILTGHYRNPINFSQDLIESAGNGLTRIKNSIKTLKHFFETVKFEKITEGERSNLEELVIFEKNFEKAMDDDFNTADAITAIFELVKFANKNINENSSKEFISNVLEKLLKLSDILGIIFEVNSNDKSEISEQEIEDLIQKRQEARKNKDFKQADEIRDKLSKKGVILDDTPTGVRWSRG